MYEYTVDRIILFFYLKMLTIMIRKKNKKQSGNSLGKYGQLS